MHAAAEQRRQGGFAVAILTLVLAVLPVHQAAAELIEDAQTWLTLSTVGHLGATATPWRYLLDLHSRIDDGSSRFGLAIVRGGFGYAVTPAMILWTGYSHVVIDPQGPGGNISEHRIWEQMTWVAPHPIAGMLLSTRSNLEQRSQETGSEVGWRLRQLFKLIRPLSAGSPWSLVAADEVMFNLNGTAWGVADGFDQNRAFAGLGLNVNAHARAEVGYMNQFVARDSSPDVMNHAVAVNILLNF